MSDKLLLAREFILGKIENGEYKGGHKLPAAREICDEMGVSLAIAQSAFNTLTREGILASVARQGTYVRQDWSERILPGSFKTMRKFWKELIADTVVREIPGIRICHQYSDALYELRTTYDVQWRQEHYLDLTEFLNRAYPDQSDFFMSQLNPFYSRNGKLYALPLIFSPWAVSYNEEMILRGGGKIPKPDWTWEEFIELVKTLRQVYTPQETFHFVPHPSFWMIFLFRAGGKIIDKHGDGFSVELDSPQTLNGICKIKELFDAVNIPKDKNAFTDTRGSFLRGETALAMTAREDVNFNAGFPWGCVSVPSIAGGAQVFRQAADLLCVRSQVSDLEQVTEVIKLLLSQTVQDRIAASNYGIPIRKSSAIGSFRENDPRDAVFFSNMTKIVPDNNFVWPELYSLVGKGLSTIWEENADPNEVVGELVPMLETYIKYELRECNHAYPRPLTLQ